MLLFAFFDFALYVHAKTRTEETREDIGAVLVGISWYWLGVEVADHCTSGTSAPALIAQQSRRTTPVVI